MARKVTPQSIIASNWPPPIWNCWLSSRGLSAIAELLVHLVLALILTTTDSVWLLELLFRNSYSDLLGRLHWTTQVVHCCLVSYSYPSLVSDTSLYSIYIVHSLSQLVISPCLVLPRNILIISHARKRWCAVMYAYGWLNRMVVVFRCRVVHEWTHVLALG